MNLKIDFEKKSYGKSIIELVSQSLNFDFHQELAKKVAIDLNFNDIQLSQENVEQLSQFIKDIHKLRSLRFCLVIIFEKYK